MALDPNKFTRKTQEAIGAAQAADPVKISFGPTTLEISTGHAAQSSIPLALGYWKDEGLDVNVFGTAGSTAGIQQMAAGNLNFATVGGEALLVARAKGLKLKAFYMFARESIYRIADRPERYRPASHQPVAGRQAGYGGGHRVRGSPLDMRAGACRALEEGRARGRAFDIPFAFPGSTP